MDLRRKLYDEADGYWMIAASVTDEAWPAQIPADTPVLIVAEGLLMYLHDTEVRHLPQRLTSPFRTGTHLRRRDALDCQNHSTADEVPEPLVPLPSVLEGHPRRLGH